MVVGTVTERCFLHFSTWDKPPPEMTLDTRQAWTASNYWQRKIEFKPQVPDEDFAVGSLTIKRGPVARFLNELTAIGKHNCELLKEYIFDEVREREFAHLPSRRRCMFLFDAEHDPTHYAEQLKFTQMTLYECEALEGTLHRASLPLLNCNSLSAPELREQARRYWMPTDRGIDTELLFEGQVRLRRIDKPGA